MKIDRLFINVWDYVSKEYPFNIFVGGRGTGKTYSALSGVLDLPDKFIFMRRTQSELEAIAESQGSHDDLNPFKAINKDKDTNIGIAKINKKMYGFYHMKEINDELKPAGEAIGYAVALSTFATIRGADFSDCSTIIYDEFIPEEHVRKFRKEGDALFNAYESMNRNREFLGMPPMTMLLLANSNNLYNEVFISLNIVHDVERMIKKDVYDKFYPERCLAVHRLKDNPAFVEKKKNTALYKLTKGTKFAAMALGNTFAYDDFSLVQYQKLDGYRPIANIGKAFIYAKKGDRLLYVSYSPARAPYTYNIDNMQDIMAFNQRIGHKLRDKFVDGSIYFESYELKQIILDIIL